MGKPAATSGAAVEASTIVQILQCRAACQPNQRGYSFLVDGENEELHLTYGELDREARVIAARLQRVVVPGARAMLLFHSGLRFIAAFLGCLYANVIAVPADAPRKNKSLSTLLAHLQNSAAEVVLTTKSIAVELQERRAEVGQLKEQVWIETDELDSELATGWHEVETRPETLAFLQYTSGSTGIPKGVMVSHANLLHNQRMICKAFRHTENTIVAGWLPLFHDMGLIGNVLQSLYLGVPCILMAPLAFLQRPYRWLDAISRYRVTTSGAPNFAYDLCVRKITPEQTSNLDLSCWKVAYNGAEPVRSETLDRFATAFGACGFRRAAFLPCYGMAEATLFVSGGPSGLPPSLCMVNSAALEENRVMAAVNDRTNQRIFVGCGKTWDRQQVVIVDPDSLTRSPAGQIGEIWLAGPSIAQGYWNRPEETKQTFQAYLSDTGEGPFLRTGDLGFLKDDLFVAGRLKDRIIIRGRKYYPEDIEVNVQSSHPALQAGCGAAFSVEISGEEHLVIAQEIVPRYRTNLDTAEVIGNIRQAVAHFHELNVFKVFLLKSGGVPKTSSGKIRRQTCRRQFLANELELYETTPRGNIVAPNATGGIRISSLSTAGDPARLGNPTR